MDKSCKYGWYDDTTTKCPWLVYGKFFGWLLGIGFNWEIMVGCAS